MSGKGSKPRPLSVDLETFNANWDKIFNSINKTKSSKKDTKDAGIQKVPKRKSNRNS
jgi:hypothetical protein